MPSRERRRPPARGRRATEDVAGEGAGLNNHLVQTGSRGPATIASAARSATGVRLRDPGMRRIAEATVCSRDTATPVHRTRQRVSRASHEQDHRTRCDQTKGMCATRAVERVPEHRPASERTAAPDRRSRRSTRREETFRIEPWKRTGSDVRSRSLKRRAPIAIPQSRSIEVLRATAPTYHLRAGSHELRRTFAAADA